MGLAEQPDVTQKSGVTEQWAANPSWPREQQRLFERLKDRFAAHLVPSETQPAAAFSLVEEEKILNQIDAGRWDRAMTMDGTTQDGISLDGPADGRTTPAERLSDPKRL